MINIGKLNKQIIIQYKNVTRSSYGDETITWTTEDTVWASVQPLTLRQRESFVVQQNRAEVTHEIHMRYRRNLTPEKRMKYGDRIFDIDSIINVNERDEELLIYATEHIRSRND